MEKEAIIETLRTNRALLDRFHVVSLSIFGSVVRNGAGPESDIDILVEFDPDAKVGLFTFVYFKDVLSDLLGCHVDLVARDALHPALRDAILKEAVLVA
jgi:predicted nucleotidyltransferase